MYKVYFTTDDDYTYTANTLEELVVELDKYILHDYGNYLIWHNHEKLNDCLAIKEPGNYSLATYIGRRFYNHCVLMK